ncbi:MAG TPA: GAF domain-containing sensor histidine kinase [Stenomitos sp.]
MRRDEAIRLRPQLVWLSRGALVMGAVGLAAWLGNHQAALLAAVVGSASLAIFGWEAPRDEGGHPSLKGMQELGAAFKSLCSEHKLEGTLYAYFEDEQLLRPVASTDADLSATLRIGTDPVSRSLQTLKPQIFNAYAAPTALGQASFHGRSTLVFPMVRQGRPVGVAVLASRQAEIGGPLVDHVRAAEPQLSLLLDNEVLAGRLAKSQNEKEALLALTRLAQGQSDPDQVFREAAVHLRRLTGASHAAIALRAPGGRLTLAGLSADGGAKIRETFLAIDWAEREWPHVHQAFRDPMGSVLLRLAQAPLTPTESAWAQQIAPDGHLLCVAFGPQEDREGLVILCWPEETALRLQESRLAQRLGDLMALIASSRRQSHSRQDAEAHEASAVQLASTQEALLSRLMLEARNAAYAVRHFREALQAGKAQPGEVLTALEQQATMLAAWPGADEAPEQEAVSLASCLMEAHAIARETCRRKGQALLLETVPDAEVAVPPADVIQVLGTLLDNASRYSAMGTSVRLWAAVSEAWVTVYVADHGSGIPPELQARIGEPGFQVVPALGGQGMGLALARELLDRAGGMLGFTSQLGAGSTFYVTLPRRGV